MAKKAKDRASGSATAKGLKIPKQIAGVKVPKKLRKSGEALIARANSPIGREVLAAGIAAVATAAAASRAKAAGNAEPHPGAKPGAGTPTPTPTPSGTSDVNVDKIVDAVNALATSFLQKLRDRQG